MPHLDEVRYRSASVGGRAVQELLDARSGVGVRDHQVSIKRAAATATIEDTLAVLYPSLTYLRGIGRACDPPGVLEASSIGGPISACS